MPKKTKPSKTRTSNLKNSTNLFANHKIALISALLTIIIVAICIIIQSTHNHTVVTLTPSYYTSSPTTYDLSSSAYEQLIDTRESFVVMVDNPDCVTTARMREYLSSFQDELPFSYYRMMWPEVQQTDLKNTVNYFPSLVIIDHGQPVYHLRADSDEDAPYYNDADALKSWLEERIDFTSVNP